MRFLLFCLALGLFSCGQNNTEFIDAYQYQHTSKMKYQTVANTTLLVNAVDADSLALVQAITYTSLESNQLSADISTLLPPVEDASGENIDLGALGLTGIKLNKLKICGISGKDKCTSAIIRMYTNDLGGLDAGLGGFVNITENYAEAPVTVTGTSGDVILGHTLANANTLSAYTIPSNDRKLTTQDFVGAGQLLSFPINVDFSNAGAGDYSMSIELEIAIGPIP